MKALASSSKAQGEFGGFQSQLEFFEAYLNFGCPKSPNPSENFFLVPLSMKRVEPKYFEFSKKIFSSFDKGNHSLLSLRCPHNFNVFANSLECASTFCYFLLYSDQMIPTQNTIHTSQCQIQSFQQDIEGVKETALHGHMATREVCVHTRATC